MKGTNDTGRVTNHECELVPLNGDEFDSMHDKGKCERCGLITTPSQGVSNARQNRKW